MFSNIRNLFRKELVVAYPLSILDAASGDAILPFVPEEYRYKLGPFNCDLSPMSHTGSSKHAVDFLVKDGTPVYAAKSGTVIDIQESHEIYGTGPEYAKYLNYVTIDHGACYSQYAHLKKGSATNYGLYVGKKVVGGQVIGVVGKSGWVDYEGKGEHLHFMIFRDLGDTFESLPVRFK